MWKFMMGFAHICWFLWAHVRPRFQAIMHIIAEVKLSGLKEDAARKKVFQEVTDLLQANGFEEWPDNVINCAIELVYEVYIWQNKDRRSTDVCVA